MGLLLLGLLLAWLSFSLTSLVSQYFSFADGTPRR